MPEMPEVEALRRVLIEDAVSASIVSVQCRNTRLLKCTAQNLKNNSVGTTITGVDRYGKCICVNLSNLYKVIVHFAINGELNIWDREPFYYDVLLQLSNNKCLVFTDLHGMARMDCSLSNELDLGPEVFDAEFTFEYFNRFLSLTGAAIKPVLMNQHFVAGIGNAYVCDILFDAKVNPATPANELSYEDKARLYKSIKTVMQEGLDRCIAASRLDNKLSNFESIARRDMKVYGKTGYQCPVCGATIKHDKVGGRATFYCPTCQSGGAL